MKYWIAMLALLGTVGMANPVLAEDQPAAATAVAPAPATTPADATPAAAAPATATTATTAAPAAATPAAAPAPIPNKGDVSRCSYPRYWC